MARRQKKSGRRRAGGEKRGRGWPFFALFVLAGLGFLVPFVLQGMRDYTVFHQYVAGRCEVLLSESVYHSAAPGVGKRDTRQRYPQVRFSLMVEGQRYTVEGYDNYDGLHSDSAEVGQWRRGESYPCWYLPSDPNQAVLERRFVPYHYAAALIPLFFVAIGGHFLLRTLRGRKGDPAIRTRRGTHLPLRLRPIASPRLLLHVVGVASMALFAAASALAWHSWEQRFQSRWGEPYLFLISVLLLLFLLRRLPAAWRIGRTPTPRVEIPRAQWHPGEALQLHLEQRGPAHFADYRVELLCESIAAQTRVLHRQQLWHQPGLRCDRHAPVALHLEARLPESAPESRRELQQLVRWLIRVTLLPQGVQQGFEVDFPFAVQRND